MNESKRRGKVHSAEAFIESHDLWWNADFLDLCRKRWRLAKVKTVLDVGCGVGHWGRTLAPLFRTGTAAAIGYPDASFDMVTCQAVPVLEAMAKL